MDMNIQKYMAFVKTVEYGSFTRAAEMLNYSQSGISRMINDLEKEWIADGRVDCGFLRLPARSEFETCFLEQDKLLAVLPENHSLAHLEKIPVAALCDEPFMLLEKGAKAEVSEIYLQYR